MNIFKQFYLSLYSPKDIAKFRFQGIGKTILYVFFLTLISLLPSFIYFGQSISEGLESSLSTLQSEFPDFEIKNGNLHTDTTETIETRKNDFTLFFDGTGTMTEQDVAVQSTNGFALLKTQFVLVAQGSIQTYPYSMLESLVISKEDIEQFLISMKSMLFIFLPVIGLTTYVFNVGIEFIEISILAFIGLLFKNSTGRNITYRHLWRLVAYSVTLSTVFFTIMAFLKTNVVGGFMINWFVTFVILILSIREIPKPKQRNIQP
jgi:Protein of unknown function (DUF1189)